MAKQDLSIFGKARDEVKTIADGPLAQIVADFVAKAIEEMKEAVPTSQADTGVLKQSIGFEFESEGQVLTYNFLAADYWDFVNSGVDGVQGSAGAITNVFGSTYSFKTLNPSPKMVDAFAGAGSMQNWLAAKGITSLTYGGKTKQLTTDADYRAAAYVFARAVKRKGIKPRPFINNALSEEKLIAFETALLDAFENIL